jgi:methylated-DNA-protein-cysteine methyltransferase-like protein
MTNIGFFKQVYEIVKQIPEGSVSTYGQIANMLGSKDARKVGWALHSNKDPLVPCHRVVNKKGKLAPNFAFNGMEEQKRLLQIEGITFRQKHFVDLEKHIWKTS